MPLNVPLQTFTPGPFQDLELSPFPGVEASSLTKLRRISNFPRMMDYARSTYSDTEKGLRRRDDGVARKLRPASTLLSIVRLRMDASPYRSSNGRPVISIKSRIDSPRHSPNMYVDGSCLLKCLFGFRSLARQSTQKLSRLVHPNRRKVYEDSGCAARETTLRPVALSH